MEDNQASNGSSAEPKKIGLAEAMKRKLEQKKQAQSAAKGGTDHYSTATKKMTSQIKKKPNNQKKRTGV
ncbi:hypothetical protein [Cohnella thailandensis]|jgi:hypothetical protein|uniref:Uncharacterized protein n=1 Tax=Cohnella thailandensis TaxID=557557 RepID=A0A841SW65_9BACL|nr:hypothetical protein [Cohnella thailandensis]MBB6635209.1 hypothetical protein [Cohnella thailandensis]MBP1974325.1 hypothetical protein [Cohnella thailandensis]